MTRNGISVRPARTTSFVKYVSEMTTASTKSLLNTLKLLFTNYFFLSKLVVRFYVVGSLLDIIDNVELPFLRGASEKCGRKLGAKLESNKLDLFYVVAELSLQLRVLACK